MLSAWDQLRRVAYGAREVPTGDPDCDHDYHPKRVGGDRNRWVVRCSKCAREVPFADPPHGNLPLIDEEE